MTDQTAHAYRLSDYTDEDDECPELSDGGSGFDYNQETRCSFFCPAI